MASHGFLVVPNGPPNGTGNTNAQYQRDASTWIHAHAGAPGRYSGVDVSRMAAAGQSCGGLETYAQRDNPLVSYLGIFNSGFLPGGADNPNLPDGTNNEDPATIGEVHKPVVYCLGGPTDIAYENPNGGAFGVAAVQWLQWVLQKNETAGKFFTAGGAQQANWTEVESEGLDAL
ncbi:hypothetical protein PG988_003533 [Apiospora saccharicola]